MSVTYKNTLSALQKRDSTPFSLTKPPKIRRRNYILKVSRLLRVRFFVLNPRACLPLPFTPFAFVTYVSTSSIPCGRWGLHTQNPTPRHRDYIVKAVNTHRDTINFYHTLLYSTTLLRRRTTHTCLTHELYCLLTG